MHTYADELTIKALLPRDRRQHYSEGAVSEVGDSGNFCSIYLTFSRFRYRFLCFEIDFKLTIVH